MRETANISRIIDASRQQLNATTSYNTPAATETSQSAMHTPADCVTGPDSTSVMSIGRVVVLMSTYEGERWVAEQLRSILAQLPSDGRILVRDDGSRDSTAHVIESIGDARIILERGTNLGFSASFLTLLSAAPQDADMVMFSDQDDVWMPDKIARAWAQLQACGDGPALYGSTQLLVDSDLRPLKITAAWQRGPSFSSALTENIITGCTAALNRPALQLLQRAGIPQGVHLHDWWVYLVVSAFGTVVFDDQPTLLYRQHSSNQIGHGWGWLGRELGIVRFLMRHDWVGMLLAQVRALLRHYGEQLPPEARAMVLRHFGIRGDHVYPRWSLVFSARRWRQGLVWDLALRVLLVTHRLHLWPLPGRRLA